MQGLLLRLYDVDGESERALRVIAYFDQLIRHHADAATVVRAGAALAECAAGIDVPRGLAARFGPDGGDLEPGLPSGTRAVHADAGLSDSGVRVWLERDGEQQRELDALILERMAMAVDTILERRSRGAAVPAAEGLADPALLEILLSAQATSIERARAARLAGIPVDGLFTLVAVRDTGRAADLLRAVRERWQSPLWGARVEPDVIAVLLRASIAADDLARLLPGSVGTLQARVPLAALAGSWRRVSAGLKVVGMSRSWPGWLPVEQLGALTLLADLDVDAAAGHPDVVALSRVRARFGDAAIDDLDAIVTRGSLRQAAVAVHLHHTTLAARARRYGEELGFDVGDSLGRARLLLALALLTAAQRQGRVVAG